MIDFTAIIVQLLREASEKDVGSLITFSRLHRRRRRFAYCARDRPYMKCDRSINNDTVTTGRTSEMKVLFLLNLTNAAKTEIYGKEKRICSTWSFVHTHARHTIKYVVEGIVSCFPYTRALCQSERVFAAIEETERRRRRKTRRV